MDAYEQLRIIGRGSYGCAVLVRPRQAETSTQQQQAQGPGSSAGAATSAASRAAGAGDDAAESASQRLYVIKQISLAAIETEREEATAALTRSNLQQPRGGAAPGSPLDQPQVLLPAASASPQSSSAHAQSALLPLPMPVARPLVPDPSTLLNEVQIMMCVGDGHPNVARYRSSFLMSSQLGAASSNSGQSFSAPPSPHTRHSSRMQRNNDILCIVMDFYAGGDLSRKIKRRKRHLIEERQRTALATASSSAALTHQQHSASSSVPPSPAAHLHRASAASSAAASNASLVSLSDHMTLTSTAASSALEAGGVPPPLFSEELVLDYLVQLGLGLKHCHDRHVLHRDLKTSNVFISLERPRAHHRISRRSGGGKPAADEAVEVLRIGDFGIARLMDPNNALARTRIGTVSSKTAQRAQQKQGSQRARRAHSRFSVSFFSVCSHTIWPQRSSTGTCTASRPTCG